MPPPFSVNIPCLCYDSEDPVPPCIDTVSREARLPVPVSMYFLLVPSLTNL